VPNEWLRKRKKDHFHRLAKARGFRSRATFKLIQVVKKYQFLVRGDYVLDLGAAPGGWLQAAHQVASGVGFVLGVDKEAIRPLDLRSVSTLVGDVTTDKTLADITATGFVPFDVVLSDLAPNVSGVWEVDNARQIELARCALKVARAVLRPSGNMLVKVFQGIDLPEFQAEMKSAFKVLRIVKPPASRSESAELYLLGLGFLGDASH
jgi:23S rRNA (uridine2552-2'-O)-methyltransferase